jgi:hypothetical protein
MAGRFDQKKQGPARPGADQDAQKDQEQEKDQEQTQEQEQTRSHNTIGNQALAAMMSTRADPATLGTEGGGGGRSVRRRKEPEQDGVDYGGDGDIDDVPLSLEDLTASWNPGIRKSEDRPRYVEPMPDDDLPPEDAAWLDAVRDAPHSGPLPRIDTIDALLQPSPATVARSMAGWSRAAGRWASPTLAWRAVAHMLDHPTPILQDPHARVLPARTAVAALASCLLAESPPVRTNPTLETGALIEFCLELEGRAHRVANVIESLDDQRARLPRARDLVSRRLPAGGAPIRRIEAAPGDHAALCAALDALVRWEPLEDNVPPLRPDAPVEDEDDPLGLDRFLVEELGGPRDVDAELYQAGLQAAERLASAASLTRIRWSAAAVLVGEVAALWSGAPVDTLVDLAAQLDEEVDGALKLLLEVARACQKKTVPPRGVHNGLRRGARQLDALRTKAISELALVCAALLPGRAGTAPPPVLRPDPLSQAFDAGHPAEAAPWLASLPADLDRDAALLLTRAAAGVAPEALDAPSHAVRERALREIPPGPLTTALTIVRAHVAHHLGALDEATDLGAAIRVVGRARRNGLLIAEGAMIVMEASVAADRLDEAERVRLEAGRTCLDLGAWGALSLLARWAPPEPEPEDFAPFFDYPMDVDDEETPEPDEG